MLEGNGGAVPRFSFAVEVRTGTVVARYSPRSYRPTEESAGKASAANISGAVGLHYSSDSVADSQTVCATPSAFFRGPDHCWCYRVRLQHRESQQSVVRSNGAGGFTAPCRGHCRSPVLYPRASANYTTLGGGAGRCGRDP